MTQTLLNYAADEWVAATGNLADLRSAVTGAVVARTGSEGLNFKAMLDHARAVGGPALRAMTFQGRARIDVISTLLCVTARQPSVPSEALAFRAYFRDNLAIIRPTLR